MSSTYRKGLPWSTEDDETVTTLWNDQTYTVSMIAQVLHRTCAGVEHRAADLGLPVKAPPLTTWGGDRSEQLLAWWKEGYSSSQIAKLFAAQGVSVTRNAVIGRLHRLGESGKRSASAKVVLNLALNSFPRPPKAAAKPPKPMKAKPAPKVFEAPPPRPPRAVARDAAFQALPGSSPRPWDTRTQKDCKWPIEMPHGETYSCCQPIIESGYCLDHYALSLPEPARPAAIERLARRPVRSTAVLLPRPADCADPADGVDSLVAA